MEVKRPDLTLSTPFRILPPATPPFKSSTSQPGLFTSKDLMTETQKTFTGFNQLAELLIKQSFTAENQKDKDESVETKTKLRTHSRLVRTLWMCVFFFLPMSLGSDVKSLMGTGIFLTMYSQTTSMLYFSCAEIGMMGAPSATVPAGGTWHHQSQAAESQRENKVTWRVTSLKWRERCRISGNNQCLVSIAGS